MILQESDYLTIRGNRILHQGNASSHQKWGQVLTITFTKKVSAGNPKIVARPLRIEYDGAWYHVMNRGLERRIIFHNDEDRLDFFHFLKEITILFGIEIHAFSLMNNHYHLLVHTPYGQLGRAMRHLNGLYTQRFNKRKGRDGPLFRGRYKAKLVDDNNYLSELIRYIHRNPVEAKICVKAGDHKWTSHYHYLKNKPNLDWLDTERLLQLFGSNNKAAKKKLDNFVRQGTPEDVQFEIEKCALNIIGTDGFKKWVEHNAIAEIHRKSKSIPRKQKKLPHRQTPTQILENVAFMHKMSCNDLRRPNYDNDAKKEAAYFLRAYLGMPLNKIAKFVNMTNANSVSQALFRIRTKIKTNRTYAKSLLQKAHYLQSAK